MARHVSSAPLQRVFDFPTFEAMVDFNVAGGPLVLMPWTRLGSNFTALAWSGVNVGPGTDLTFTVEFSPDGIHVVTKGPGLPTPLVVPVGEASLDQYGIDLTPVWWRYSVSGTGAGKWGMGGLPR